MSTGVGRGGGGLLMSLKGMAARLVRIFGCSGSRTADLSLLQWFCESETCPTTKLIAVVLRQKKTAIEVELVVTPSAQ